MGNYLVASSAFNLGNVDTVEYVPNIPQAKDLLFCRRKSAVPSIRNGQEPKPTTSDQEKNTA